MTIGRFLSVSISALALIAGSLGGMVAYEKWGTMQDMAAASARLSALRAMADIPASVNVERGLFALQMPIVAPGDQSQHQAIADSERDTDTAFANAKAKVGALAGRVGEADEMVAGVNRAIGVWLDTRAKAEEILQQTPIDKRVDAPSMLVDQNSKVNAAVAKLMRDELRRLADTSGNAYRFADIANSVTELRDVGGRQFGIFINVAGTKKPATPETRVGLLQFEGQVQLIGIHLLALAEAPDVPEALKSALAIVKAGYYGELQSDKKLIFAALETGNYPFEPAALRAKSLPNWKKILDLRDAAYVAAEDAIRTENGEETQRFYFAIGGAVLAVALSVLIGFMVRSRVTKPLAGMTDSMAGISSGDLDRSIPGLTRTDEIGAMAQALQVFKDGLQRNRELELDTSRERASSESRRKAMLADLATTFERSVGGIAGSLAASARELEGAARAMSQTAVETSNRSTSVAAAAEEASTNVGSVASSAEELGSSVHEISRQVEQSSQMSRAAVNEASETAGIVRELSFSAGKISDVLSLISTIAGQTNLLALNATIEAARAGEAGRGFAIVASEVKELANQTAKATSDISEQIGAIQGSTKRAVGAIDGIAETIQSMNSVAAAISASVEQQGAATNEIVRTIAQASAGTADVTSNIGAVARAANESGAVASQVLTASAMLSRQADDLRHEVETFLQTVRAA